MFSEIQSFFDEKLYDQINRIVFQKKKNLIVLELKNVISLSDTELDSFVCEFEKQFPLLHVSFQEASTCTYYETGSAPTETLQTVLPSLPIQKDPDVFYGKKIKPDPGNIITVHELSESDKPVTILARISSGEIREGWGFDKGKNKTYRLQLNVTDDSDSIYCIISFSDEKKAQKVYSSLSEYFNKPVYFYIKGACKFAKYAKELTFYPNDINLSDQKVNLREDSSDDKRVELHLHTRMSTMDGLTDVTKAFELAKKFGHKALAITDHGVVQSFPEAAKASKKTGVKVLFGVEGYLLPDSIMVPIDSEFIVFDIETTGLKPENSDIIEIGAVKIKEGCIIDRFQTFINDGVVIPPNITQLTNITNDMLLGAPSLKEVLLSFKEFCGNGCLVAHNAKFDIGFIQFHSGKFDLQFNNIYTDTLILSKYLLHDLSNHKLDTLCEYYNINLENHHRASDDAAATGEILLNFINELKQLSVAGIPAFKMEYGKSEKQKTNHIIILAKTQDGLKNLYRIISYSHLDYFRTRPVIPRSLLTVYRNGLILGSACEQGELFQSILKNESSAVIDSIARYYDFLEIQPICNNAFMLRNGTVSCEEDLRNLNREIVSLGDRLGIPVVATGDVHFLNPEDGIFRKILLCKLGFKDYEFQAPLYFKTTNEMMEEFSYLGLEQAHRIVIDNPNMIADCIEELKPFPDGTHAPEIPNASNELEQMAITKAHEIYGEILPEVVQKRLDKELKSIIGNGFASLYLMAQRLVHKSLSDGYLVGSRGSVGSSFVATMAGITEVNPLPPHYVCDQCKFSDFDVDLPDSACGVDLPDRICPVCNSKLRKKGYDIPFEVFLGFKGDKTPDIDLNFSGEYQPVAHKYVEEMFGKGHAFRAGTISGLAERKAFECIYHYQEESGVPIRKAEMERLCKGCLNVKVTTGQHPGGIVIVPKEDDILDYTPVQYPADKQDKNTITTHFDFHAMDDRLVKLDILGHDDPTALKMLQDITGLDPRSVPLDDPETMSLFSSSDALNIDLSEINCSVGSIAIPEFGTGFVRGVLDNTKPNTMEELVRISGLTHGTDVWLNNAEPLVMNKIAKLSEVLCTRDDIMNYLIAHGLDASKSFTIMEKVRKGKGLSEDLEKYMRDGNIPEWFIDSCKKIKYMFPRGHAVAYVTMAFRIAYYKVHYPLAFYAVYFSVRADAFDINLASGGPDKLLGTIKDLEKNSQNKEPAEKKRDKEIETILEVVYEMNLRGIKMLPVDIYKSDAVKFLIEDNAIRPPFTSIPGIGSSAAIPIVEKRGNNRFISIEDFQKKTNANSGIVSLLDGCGCFNGMPKTNQISLFDA